MSTIIPFEIQWVENPVITWNNNKYLCTFWFTPKHDHVHRWVFKLNYNDDGAAYLSDDCDEYGLILEIWDECMKDRVRAKGIAT